MFQIAKEEEALPLVRALLAGGGDSAMVRVAAVPIGVRHPAVVARIASAIVVPFGRL